MIEVLGTDANTHARSIEIAAPQVRKKEMKEFCARNIKKK